MKMADVLRPAVAKTVASMPGVTLTPDPASVLKDLWETQKCFACPPLDPHFALLDVDLTAIVSMDLRTSVFATVDLVETLMWVARALPNWALLAPL